MCLNLMLTNVMSAKKNFGRMGNMLKDIRYGTYPQFVFSLIFCYNVDKNEKRRNKNLWTLSLS